MTVADLRSKMSNSEYRQWAVYYGRKNQRQELAQKRRGGPDG